jgi:drug/metabolite transporter (DMT)-like permease
MKKYSSHNLALLALLLASMLWALVPSVLKLTLNAIPPFSLQFLRFSLASILVLPFFLRERKNLHGEYLKLFLFSLLPFLNVTLFILGIRLTAASVTPVLYAATPILVVIFSRLLLKETISLPKAIGIFFGFLGVLMIALLPIIGSEGNKIGNMRGNFIVLLAVFSWTLYTIFSKFILKKHSPLVTNSLFCFISTLFTLPLAGFELMNNSSWLTSVSSQALLGVFYLGSFATAGTFFLYQWAVKHSSALEASLSFYLQPIFGSLAAVIILKERLTFLFIIGAIITLLGVFLTTTLSYLRNSR